jgi:hypothetical protein
MLSRSYRLPDFIDVDKRREMNYQALLANIDALLLANSDTLSIGWRMDIVLFFYSLM